ncbi:hypothetical protein QOZ88_09105 [Blastococcus sp. BMG 814]|uniref:Glycosyltransferase RgtA/B/C/D-like domain-containing protein n=1 Tax=Blastococcus carthaginiensis TaxID=3050034 RepID=A0ABT9IB50_9ACTN|nr:hypothetical protein [Blastococcus carthaginiensis]MDP5182797.1 hypothetical protein [Blastococcus carthaginiensis]
MGSRTSAAAGRTWVAAHWTGVLVALGTALFAANVAPVYPGLMSWDSVRQLEQAVDLGRLDDWHPPVMTVLWRVLMSSSGSVGSLLVAQLALLWGSLTLLSVYVHRRGGRRLLSLLPLGIGLLPYVVSISGVIWKDQQLAFALLGAVVLLLHLREGIRRVWLRNTTIAVTVLLLAYAGAVRYNALPALVPLLFLLTWPGAARRGRLLLAAGTVALSLAATPVIDAVRPVQETHPAASIMVDDVLHLYTVAELRTAAVDPPLEEYLVRMATSCPPGEFDVNYTWRCANTTGTVPAVFLTHHEQLRGLYLRGIAEHPLRYAQFRLGVFADFLDTPPEQVFVSWYGIQENALGLTFAPGPAVELLASYEAFTARNFGFLYRPFFWLLAAVAVTAVAWRRRPAGGHARVVAGIGASAAVYIVSYLPMVIGYDYRYVYWPAVGVTVAAVLLLLDAVLRRRGVAPHREPGATVGVPRAEEDTAPVAVGERLGRVPPPVPR